jgi:hypothetical protein
MFQNPEGGRSTSYSLCADAPRATRPIDTKRDLQ